jgi:hypothetical protein
MLGTRVTRDGVELHVGLVPLLAWSVWAATGALSPLPPWSAGRLLALEEATAARLAAAPARLADWSFDVGGTPQAGALGAGWSESETALEAGRRRSFVWIDGERAEVRFASPRWQAARLSLAAAPLQALAPLEVEVAIDGEPRGSLSFPLGWNVSRTELGELGDGAHVLELRPRASATPPGELRRLSLAVDGIAVGTSERIEPAVDRGVFGGFLRVGLEERPALFVAADAPAPTLPPGSADVRLTPGLTAWYAFGIGGVAAAATPIVSALQGLAAAELVVLVPGLAWWARFGRSAGPLCIAELLGFSTLAWLAAFVLLRAVGAPPDVGTVAVMVALIGCAPLPFLRRERRRVSVEWAALVAALVAAAALAFFALQVVPALEDQDMEVQSTAYALATRQAPLALTNRGTPHFFAHPPLLHVWQAASFALAGRLDRVRYYAEAGERARAVPLQEPAPDTPLAARPHHAEWKVLLRRFLVEPLLWPTRQVNVLLAALAIGLAAGLAGSISGSRALGLALAAVLLTFPEYLVRGAYGGYFASTTLLSLTVLAGLHAGAREPGLMPASALAFLANQKGLLVPAAWVAAAPAGTSVWQRLRPAAGGLLAAAGYLVYGLAIDRDSFVYDFLKEHVARRLTPADVRLASDASRFYPSIPQLWLEFAARYGVVFLLLAAWAAARGLARGGPAVRTAAAAVLLGAAVFSVTDWRQTKHLSLLAAPAIVALAGCVPPTRFARRVAIGLCLALAARNLWTVWPLLTDFLALRPSTSW